MLTEALKRKYDKLEKLAKERGMVFEILRAYRWPDDLSKIYFFSLMRGSDELLEFQIASLENGFNRLMREIKAYPVVS